MECIVGSIFEEVVSRNRMIYNYPLSKETYEAWQQLLLNDKSGWEGFTHISAKYMNL